MNLAPCVNVEVSCERKGSCAAEDFWTGMSRVLVRELRSTTIGGLLEKMKTSQGG